MESAVEHERGAGDSVASSATTSALMWNSGSGLKPRSSGASARCARRPRGRRAAAGPRSVRRSSARRSSRTCAAAAARARLRCAGCSAAPVRSGSGRTERDRPVAAWAAPMTAAGRRVAQRPGELAVGHRRVDRDDAAPGRDDSRGSRWRSRAGRRCRAGRTRSRRSFASARICAQSRAAGGELGVGDGAVRARVLEVDCGYRRSRCAIIDQVAQSRGLRLITHRSNLRVS